MSGVSGIPMMATVSYAQVPPEIVQVAAYSWRAGRPAPLPLPVVRRAATFVLMVERMTDDVVMQFRRTDGTYLLDGPFAADDSATVRRLDLSWRRTLEGRLPGEIRGAAPSLEWLSASGEPRGNWPACWSTAAGSWTCMGVPVGESGVVAGVIGTRLISAPVIGASTPAMAASQWGRLVLVSDPGGSVPTGLRVVAARAVAASSRRPGLRLETERIGDTRVTVLTASAMWITGESATPGAWMEVRSVRSGPRYLPLEDVAGGTFQLPVRVQLDEGRGVDLTVVTGGERAPRTLLTLFRLIDPLPAPGGVDRPPPRRVLIVEALTDDEGSARLDGLGESDYEVVAWHPQLGRASILLPAGAERATIHLQSPGIARGRVLAGGKPVAGVDVIGVPDPAAFAAAGDPLDVKAGDARSGADGRFVLALAPGGGGELRIGGGVYPVRRVPLPRVPVHVVDLGEIELGSSLTVSVVLDRDPGCALHATGPLGRTGLQIITARRTGPGLFALVLPEAGPWALGLLCGAEERALDPAVAMVSSDVREVHALVR